MFIWEKNPGPPPPPQKKNNNNKKTLEKGEKW